MHTTLWPMRVVVHSDRNLALFKRRPDALAESIASACVDGEPNTANCKVILSDRLRSLASQARCCDLAKLVHKHSFPMRPGGFEPPTIVASVSSS